MTTLNVQLADYATLKISADPSIMRELYDFFTFLVPGYKHMPLYRNGGWDGKIRLFHLFKGELLAGLFPRVCQLAEQRGWKITVTETAYGIPGEKFPIDNPTIERFVEKINTPYTLRPHQTTAIHRAINDRRALLVCPTASGKSFIAYVLVHWILTTEAKKILIIVPNVGLVEQLRKDFDSYGAPPDFTHMIYSGKDKITDKRVIITTWQSVYKLAPAWFKQFDAIIGDEAHGFKSKSLMTIMNKAHSVKYRIGMTGTLDGTQTHKMVLEGLFGLEFKVVSTKELQDAGYLAKLNITVPLLQYNDDSRDAVANMEYADEVKFLINHPKRNNFIANLAVSQKGNTLILFRYRDHGRTIYDLIQSKVVEGRKVYYVDGGVDVDDREMVRQIVETLEDAIIVASGGTFSTGTNIRNLHRLIFTHPSKGRIKVLQSIGRGLRISDNGEDTALMDLMDDLSTDMGLNTTMRHGMERIKMYKAEQFPYKVVKVKLEDGS